MTVENMTRRDVLFADDFEHVPASAAPALDLSGDYDPVAVVGTWNAVEGAHEPKGYAQIQVVRSGSGGDPGSPRAGNYLRVFRSAADGVRHQDLFGTFNASAAQIQANDVIRWSMMVNVPADGANARATFLLLGAPGNLNTARAWVRTDGAGRVFSVGPGQVPQDTGIRYVPGAWQRWDLQYAVGSTKFSVSVGGASATDLSSLSAGNVGAVHLFNGSDARGSFYVSGAVEPPTFKVRNMTTGTTIFADDFESVPAAHDLTGPFEGDLDPTARIGHWDVFEGGSASAVPAMIQVTDDVRSIGTYQTSRALRVYRNLAAGLNEQDLNAVFSAPQAKVGDVIRLSAMVYIPNDGANARAQIMFVGTPGNVVTARAWVRPDGAGNVIAVGPGYVLRNTGVRYQPNAWQRWELEYAVGSLTFSVSVNGTKVTGLPSLSTGAVAAVEMPNGATSAGAYLVAGVTGD